jgi:glycosyltransferase involved in cell wall biosynthesis
MARTVVFTEFFPPETFAGANRVGSMVVALSRAHQVAVVTLRPSYPNPDDYGADAAERFDQEQIYRVIRGGHFVAHSQSLMRRALREQAMATRLAWLGRREPADVVLTSTPSMFLGPLCLVLARLKRCMFIWDIRDVGWEFAGESERLTARLALPLALLRAVMWRVAARADVLVCATPGIAALLEDRIPGAHIVTIGNSVSAELLDACASCADEVAKPRPLVTYVGLVGDAQGLHVLVDVASELPGVDFRVVGDGPQRSRLEEHVAATGLENMQLTGYVSRPDVLEAYRMSDILFAQLQDTPTLNATGLPSKLHEYMATGKPIVYAGRGLAADTLNEIGCAITAEPGSAPSITSAIKELLSNRVMRARMGSKGRSFVVAAGDRESAFRQLAELIEAETARRSSRRLAAGRRVWGIRRKARS